MSLIKKNTYFLITFALLVIAIILFFFFKSSPEKLTLNGQEISDLTLDETEELEENRPPLELYVVDQETMPKDNGVQGTSYTAQLYIVDNVNKTTYGPYKGSSYPNSRKTKDKDKPNTVNSQMHLFNNKYGHRGSTIKGLNLVDDVEERNTEGYSWSRKPTRMQFVNVHTGFSDKGNYNSRGSLGCITIHPDQVEKFWTHFDFSVPRKHYETPKFYTKGKSEGVVYVTRINELERNSLINQIERIYE